MTDHKWSGIVPFQQNYLPEKGTAAHSSILAWRTARTEEFNSKPDGLQTRGLKESDVTEMNTFTWIYLEANKNKAEREFSYSYFLGGIRKAPLLRAL